MTDRRPKPQITSWDDFAERPLTVDRRVAVNVWRVNLKDLEAFGERPIAAFLEGFHYGCKESHRTETYAFLKIWIG